MLIQNCTFMNKVYSSQNQLNLTGQEAQHLSDFRVDREGQPDWIHGTKVLNTRLTSFQLHLFTDVVLLSRHWDGSVVITWCQGPSKSGSLGWTYNRQCSTIPQRIFTPGAARKRLGRQRSIRPLPLVCWRWRGLMKTLDMIVLISRG